MRKYKVTIWNTVNMSRDVDEEYPELEQYVFIVSAKNEDEARRKGKEAHRNKTQKGDWDSEVSEYEESDLEFEKF